MRRKFFLACALGLSVGTVCLAADVLTAEWSFVAEKNSSESSKDTKGKLTTIVDSVKSMHTSQFGFSWSTDKQVSFASFVDPNKTTKQKWSTTGAVTESSDGVIVVTDKGQPAQTRTFTSQRWVAVKAAGFQKVAVRYDWHTVPSECPLVAQHWRNDLSMFKITSSVEFVPDEDGTYGMDFWAAFLTIENPTEDPITVAIDDWFEVELELGGTYRTISDFIGFGGTDEIIAEATVTFFEDSVGWTTFTMPCHYYGNGY